MTRVQIANMQAMFASAERQKKRDAHAALVAQIGAAESPADVLTVFADLEPSVLIHFLRQCTSSEWSRTVDPAAKRVRLASGAPRKAEVLKVLAQERLRRRPKPVPKPPVQAWRDTIIDDRGLGGED